MLLLPYGSLLALVPFSFLLEIMLLPMKVSVIKYPYVKVPLEVAELLPCAVQLLLSGSWLLN